MRRATSSREPVRPGAAASPLLEAPCHSARISEVGVGVGPWCLFHQLHEALHSEPLSLSACVACWSLQAWYYTQQTESVSTVLKASRTRIKVRPAGVSALKMAPVWDPHCWRWKGRNREHSPRKPCYRHTCEGGALGAPSRHSSPSQPICVVSVRRPAAGGRHQSHWCGAEEDI